MLDFLVALDFLCCDKLKAGVEERIKERIDETNWREVLTLTQDFIGLDNTTGAALEPIFKPKPAIEQHRLPLTENFAYIINHQIIIPDVIHCANLVCREKFLCHIFLPFCDS